MIEYRTDWGKFNFTLQKYLTENKIAKNKLSKLAEVQFTQLQSYCKNTIQRPDLGVLARICFVLQCDLSDILEYVPPKE